ncbi:hypothetical protein P153DRAFT_424563 [Dothidotthia symphoricarpi CBS 119687]|uniref:SPX domain-containing protein n=1 Tax=Dothidotthia symphoricarpi CBS 119687 TaxID=1392245 RepID=A0A6A6A6X2_9PLEO|nr:uncharacterized protein P153DRAFT_424563 [Dothidotthia symphoricarpi CBS 119687]KAF2127296.1 hypothetical protein P153DRAFT_424563 [Dothidotthia symphoricarpi CBS 119687]
MKYGDTLRQRSIPEWGHYNIDYDYLKDLIKHHTTPGTNRAVSIPGQGGTSERVFGDTFLKVLQTQHDRINLFVRSKSGEIERRLDHISNTLDQQRAKRPSDTPGARLPIRTVERYAKIDADVAKIAEEIRSLSRFQVAQRTGFTKILKKYRRWTKDRELDYTFKQDISSRPDSFFQLNLGYLLDQYIDVLDTLRSIFDGDGASAPHNENTNAQSPAARLSKIIAQGDTLDLDLALSSVPLGDGGNKATYWIHPENVDQVRILLHQHMRLFTGNSKNRSRKNHAYAPTSRQSSSTNLDKHSEKDDDVSLVVLDYAESFAMKQNASTIGSSEATKGNIGIKAAGNVRCVSSSDAAVVIRAGTDLQEQLSDKVMTARLKRNFVPTFLDTSTQIPAEKLLENQTKSKANVAQDPSAVRQWLTEHKDIKPIAGIVSKRTRFVGLHNNYMGGSWATLDRDVFMKDSLHKDLEKDDWALAARSRSIEFPHAILEVRRESSQATSLIPILDGSHLVERVRGFSVETHAVWTCCKPNSMTAPIWMPLLDKDIRKLPEPARKRSRKTGSSNSGSHCDSSALASASNTSVDGQSSPLHSRAEESSSTSVYDFVDPPSLQAFRKKHRKPYSDYPPPIVHADAEPEQRYWNEYDHPEDEEEGYFIYVDPNATVKFPGQEIIEAWVKSTKKLFGMSDRADEESLLSAADDATTDDEDTVDQSPVGASRTYGTISSGKRKPSHGSYFSGLFRSLRDPHHDAEVLQERRSLLTELETRQHKAEMTKLRFYCTSLATAVVIDLILSLMTMTSRKKERGVVDVGVIFGTVSTMLLCIVAVLSMRTRNEKLGWVHQSAVWAIVAAVLGLDILLLLWVLRV